MTLRRPGMLLAFSAVFAACGVGEEADVTAVEAMPTRTFRVSPEGGWKITESPGMQPGVYPHRLVVLDVDGKVLGEEVRHGPPVLEPLPPEQDRELREFLNTEDGREFLDWIRSDGSPK